MVSAPKYLQICTADERGGDANDDFAGFGSGNGHLLNAYIFASIKDGGGHQDWRTCGHDGMRDGLRVRHRSERPYWAVWLDHDFHRTGRGMRSDFDGLDSLFDGKAMRDEAGQVEAVTIALENQLRAFRLNIDRCGVGAEQRLLVHAD